MKTFLTQISYLFITFPSKKHITLEKIHHQCFNQQTFLSFVRLGKEPTSSTMFFATLPLMAMIRNKRCWKAKKR
jgi:hypothetical protein